MKQKTIYSAKCACCDSVVLATRPIRLLDLEEAVSLRGVRHVEVFNTGNARAWPSALYAPSKPMEPSAAEMWLIHGSSR